MEMALYFSRGREVERDSGLKVWARTWKCPNTSQTSILVVERPFQSVQGGRRTRMVPRRIQLGTRLWGQSKVLGGSMG